MFFLPVPHRDHPVELYQPHISALDRAMEAGIDDVGIGALFGLYDWRFEVLGLIRHVNHFEAVYNVGPHTISFPRLKRASGVKYDPTWEVSDKDFTKGRTVNGYPVFDTSEDFLDKLFALSSAL